jgi:hypothetical protein
VISSIKDNCTDIGAKFRGRRETRVLRPPSCQRPYMQPSAHKDRGRDNKLYRIQADHEFQNSEISVALAEDIPSVNLGITYRGGGLGGKSYIDIKPIMGRHRPADDATSIYRQRNMR